MGRLGAIWAARGRYATHLHLRKVERCLISQASAR